MGNSDGTRLFAVFAWIGAPAFILLIAFYSTTYILAWLLPVSNPATQSAASSPAVASPSNMPVNAPMAKTDGENLLWPSQNFTHPRWTPLQTKLNPDVALDPTKRETASKLIETADNGRHFIYTGVADIQAGSVYTFSIYFKPQERQGIRLEVRDSQPGNYGIAMCGVNAYDQSGMATKGRDVLSSGATREDNGWYRCWATMPYSLSTVNLAVELRDDDKLSLATREMVIRVY